MKKEFLKILKEEDWHDLYDFIEELKKGLVSYIIANGKRYGMDYDNWEYMVRAEETDCPLQARDIILDLENGLIIKINKIREVY